MGAHQTLAKEMTTILLRLAILGACFLQAGCVSAMLNIGSATSGDKVEDPERVAAAAIDVVTAPIQVPILLALDPPTLAGKRFSEQSVEEKEAVRESQQRERMRRITGR